MACHPSQETSQTISTDPRFSHLNSLCIISSPPPHHYVYTQSKRLCPRRKGNGTSRSTNARRIPSDPHGQPVWRWSRRHGRCCLETPPALLSRSAVPTPPPQWKVYHERDANFGGRLPVPSFSLSLFFVRNPISCCSIHPPPPRLSACVTKHGRTTSGLSLLRMDR